MDRKRKSPVWKYYEEDNVKWEARCRLCDHPLKHHGNTTNLHRHLKAKHSGEVDLSKLNDISGNGAVAHQPSSSTKRNKMEEVKQKFASTSHAEKKKLLGQFMAMVADDLKPDSSLDLDKCDISVISQDPNSTRRKKRSSVWKYFYSQPGDKEAKCTLCLDVLRHHGNTTNLMKHLRAKHPAEAESLHGTTRHSFPDSYSSSGNVSHICSSSSLKQLKGDDAPKTSTSTRNKMLDRKVLELIIMDLQPINVVESKAFIDLMKLADPRYTLPTRKTIVTAMLPNLYKEVVDLVFKKLEDIKHVALTTEVWSPRHQESYLGVTAHFICPTSWALKSVMLSTTAFYGSPTGKHIASELERTVTEWNLGDKIRVMVTDNETSTLLANEQLPWAYIPCIAHLFHIVVTDAINADVEVTVLIEKVCDVVRFFKEDIESKEKLKEAQQSLGLPTNKLVLYVQTRWNSIYFMLERMMEQIDAVNAVLQTYDKQEMCLSTQDCRVLKQIISSLKPFEIASKTMSSENSSTINIAMPLIKGLLKMMSAVVNGKDPLTYHLKEGLNASFGKIEDVDWIVAATVLDPRFKKFPYTEKEVIDKATEIISTEISSLNQLDSEEKSKHDCSSSKDSADSLWVYLDVMANSGQEQKDETPSASKLELQRYLDSPPISRDDNSLLYWKQHQELYPTLSILAMKYMTVPITAIPRERLFTKAGESLMEKRSKLKAKNINMMLFLNRNMSSFLV